MHVIQYIRQKRIFFRFLLTYLIFFIIALAITGAFYTITFQILRNNAVDSALSILEHSRDSVDSHLREIDNIVNRMVEDYNIKAFMSIDKPLEDIDYETLRDLKAKLPYNYAYNTFIKYLYVYFPKSDVLVSPSFASGQIELMYNYYLLYEDMSYEQWKQSITSDWYYSVYWPPRQVRVTGSDFMAVTYIKSMANSYHVAPEGVVLALIDEANILSLLDNALIQNGGMSYIEDARGNRITSVNHSSIDIIDFDRQQLTGTGYYQTDTPSGAMLVMHTTSVVNQWVYIAAIPVNVIMEKINDITRTLICIAIVSFLIIFTMASVIATRNSKPIQDMMKALKPVASSQPPAPVNEYDFIKGTISSLINQNTHLKQDMNRQQILIKNIFFERLLRNRFANTDELYNHMQYAKIVFPKGRFMVMMARSSGYYGKVTAEILGELDELRVLLMNVMTQELGRMGFLHQVDESTIAAILSVGTDFDASVAVEMIRERLAAYNIRLCYGIGRPRGELVQVCESFHEAEKALDRIEGTPDTIAFYEDKMEEGLLEYYYPIQVEARLISLVKIGEKQGVRDILSHINDQNFVMRHLSREKEVLLMGELRGTLIKLKNELLSEDASCWEVVSNTLRGFHENKPAHEIMGTTASLFMELCDYVVERKKSHNNRLRDDILEYIKRDYANPDLCLYTVATKFNLAEKYFSRFFKEQSGVNFSTYLERIRMEKAKDLLVQNHYSVNDVARQVGYHNNNTFYKAFKRVHGTSPRMFKQN